jgi:hypothetical protein
MSRITPRWLTHLLHWVPVEAGIFRLNRVKDESNVAVDCSARDEPDLPQTFVDYEDNPREYPRGPHVMPSFYFGFTNDCCQ